MGREGGGCFDEVVVLFMPWVVSMEYFIWFLSFVGFGSASFIPYLIFLIANYTEYLLRGAG